MALSSLQKQISVALDPHSDTTAISTALAELRELPGVIPVLMDAGLQVLDAPFEVTCAGSVAGAFANEKLNNKLEYHNYGHTVDVMVGYIRLARSEPYFHLSKSKSIAARSKSLGLVAAVAHDLGHPGGTNPPGKIGYFEAKSSMSLIDSGALNGLPPNDQHFVCNAIFQTDHMPFLEVAKDAYIQSTVKRDNASPQAVVDALLRQADLYRSTCLTPEDAIDCGDHVKCEFQRARSSNCKHLNGLGFVDTLDTPEAQKFFTEANPCVLKSVEGEKIRLQMTKNIEVFLQPMVELALC